MTLTFRSADLGLFFISSWWKGDMCCPVFSSSAEITFRLFLSLFYSISGPVSLFFTPSTLFPIGRLP